MTTTAVDKTAKLGRYIFAAAMVAFGVEHLVVARFGQPTLPVIPFLPGNPWLGYFAGVMFLAAGVGILAGKRARLAAFVLGMFFLFCVLLLQISRVDANPKSGAVLTGAFETLSMCAFAFTLFGNLHEEKISYGEWTTLAKALVFLGPYFYAISLVVFGIDHLRALTFVGALVPAWIPGSGYFWAYFTGISFLAAGVSIATKVLARWGAFLIGVMFLFWFLFLHFPRIISFPRSHSPSEWSSALIALAMCGGSWIVAWHYFARRGSQERK